MKRRWPVILAFALLFAFVWPTPYVSTRGGERASNRIALALQGEDTGDVWLFGMAFASNNSAWSLVWLGIGAAIGYGATRALTWKSSIRKDVEK